MGRIRSECVHEKYRPNQTRLRRFLSRIKKKKQRAIFTEKKDLHGRKNPYKTGRRCSRKLSLMTKFIILLSIILSWMILILFMPFFQISDISYEGLENIKISELSSLINDKFLREQKWIPYNNFFLVNTEKIKKELLEINSVLWAEVTKSFPSSLKIIIEEKKTSLIFDDGYSYFLIDNSGEIVKYLGPVEPDEFIMVPIAEIVTTTILNSNQLALTSTTTVRTTSLKKEHMPNYDKIRHEYGNYPIFVDRRNIKRETGDTEIVSPKIISSILYFQNELTDKGVGHIRFFEFTNIFAGIKAVTNNSWHIFLNPLLNPEQQISNLFLVLKKNKPSEYIDLRSQGRAFWK
ncbi:MAG: FtsQ-type POTRA domain-containing protein [bacterium]